MGAVFLAEEEALGRLVALKLIREGHGSDAFDKEARARFKREARTMATVEHPNVVRVYAYGEADGQVYLALEYVEGETLGERIRRAGRLTPGEALPLINQVVDGLEAAWERGIVHRDVKPSNILIDAKGRAHVADFGLARALKGTSDDSSLTHGSHILGTPQYLAPEQARGQSVDHRADIYSLGLVLYECLSGRPPFEGSTPVAIIEQQLLTPLEPLSRRQPDVPESISDVVAWMTRKEAGSRPDSYATLRKALADAAAGQSPVTPPRQSSEDSKTTVVPRSGPRHRPDPVLVLALLIAVGIGAWHSLKPRPHAGAGSLRHGLRVAVAPFYGPDDDSAKEGRLTAALIEKRIGAKLGTDKVLGIDVTKEPVRSHEAARALGERLGATVVVWGEAFALKTESEISPFFTMVPLTPVQGPSSEPSNTPRLVGEDLDQALMERSSSAMHVEAAGPNQIELRRTSVSGVGDTVLLLVGIDALYREKSPKVALSYFEQVPRTAEALRYQGLALWKMGQAREASLRLKDAVVAEPLDGASNILLAEVLLDLEDYPGAASAYAQAKKVAGKELRTEQGALFEGKLFRQDAPKSKYFNNLKAHSCYLIAAELSSFKIVERYYLPGVPKSFLVRGDRLEITYEPSSILPSELTTIGLTKGILDRPVYYGSNLLNRILSMKAGFVLSVNFRFGGDEPWTYRPGAALVRSRDLVHDDAPATLPEFETALRHAMERDPTQPWHPFYLGHALYAQGKSKEAETFWASLFSDRFAVTSYSEYAWMAKHFERLGLNKWADKAFEEAVRRRQRLVDAPVFTSRITRLITAQVIRESARAEVVAAHPERSRLWLERIRRLTGPQPETDAFAFAAWANYDRLRGDTSAADREDRTSTDLFQLPFNEATLGFRFARARDIVIASFLAFAVTTFLLLGRAARHAASRAPNLRTVKSMGRWRTGLFVFTVALLCGFGVWVMLFRVSREDVVTVGFGCCLALSALWLVRRGLPPGTVLQCIPTRDRRVWLASLVVLCLSLVATFHTVVQLHGARSMPVGLMDSLGHDGTLRDLEDRLRVRSSLPLRFTAAVAYHLAGDVQRARDLYRSASADPRARADLSELERGASRPSAVPDARDLWEAFGTPGTSGWSAAFKDRDRIAHELQDYSPQQADGFWFRDIPICFAMLSLLLLLGFLIVRPCPLSHEGESLRGWWSWLRMVPGADSLSSGASGTGYLCLLLFSISVVAALSTILVRVSLGPVLFGGNGLGQLAASVPLPPTAARDHFWALFWAIPGTRVYAGFAVVCGLVSIALHAAISARLASKKPAA